MPPLKLIIEDIFFSPWAFIALVTIMFLWPLREKKRYAHPKLKWFLIVWGCLFLFSSTFFYQLFSYPLKQIIPERQKKNT